MMSGKINYLFSNLSPQLRSKIQFDDEALFSITENNVAKDISLIIVNLPGVNKNSTITDITACVGGNTISFSKFFKNVIAIEIDDTRFSMLKNNINVLNINNTKLIHGDAVSVLNTDTITQDVIFLDPPWGGPGYKSEKHLHMYLGKTDVQDFIADTLLGSAKWVVMKAPNNYAVEDLSRKLGPINISIIDLPKMKLLLMSRLFNFNSELIKKINMTYNIRTIKMPKKAAATSTHLKKSDLHAGIAEKCGITKTQVDAIMEALAEISEKELKSGNSVSIAGLVKLSARTKSATKARPFVNPKTGEKSTIPAQPAKTVPKVTVLKRMADVF